MISSSPTHRLGQPAGFGRPRLFGRLRSSAGRCSSAPAAAVAQADSAAAPKAQHKRMDPAKRMERMQEHRAKRLAALKEKLKLTSAQEGAWSSFTTAPQPPAGPRPHMDRAEFAKLTTPERLERMQTRQAERSAMFAKRADATQHLLCRADARAAEDLRRRDRALRRPPWPRWPSRS